MAENPAYAQKLGWVALILGVVGDLLLNRAAWGINFAIWVVTIFIACGLLTETAPTKPSKSAIYMAIPAILFALCFAWRDSDQLKVANLTGIFFAVGAMMVFARRGGIRGGSIMQFLIECPYRWCMLIEEDRLFYEDTLRERSQSKSTYAGRAVARGILLTLPLLLVFGGLFYGADAVFQRFVDHLFDFDLESLVYHVATFAITGLVSGGLLRRLLIAIDVPPTPKYRPPQPSYLGLTEMSIMLSGMNLLFLVFVVIQFQYLFGGNHHVAITAGLSYAQYARSGFFELVVVTMLVLPLLLGLYAWIDKSNAIQERAFRGLAGCLVLLLFVVIASAFERMSLYSYAYGLTILRVYTSSFMVWLAATFVWLVATILRGKAQFFAFGSLCAGLTVILGLNIANPDALIARTNLSRPFPDLSYIQTLGNDALPAIEEAVPHLAADQQATLRAFLAGRRQQAAKMDWRETNWADAIAARASTADPAAPL